MTKLMQWLFGFSLFSTIYTALLTRQIKSDFLDANMHIVQLLPLIVIVLFGLYAVITVLYRVFTFNDCKEAAIEMQQQIKEARADLRKKGMQFDD